MYGCCLSHYHWLLLAFAFILFLILFNHLTCLIPEVPSHCFFFSFGCILIRSPTLHHSAEIADLTGKALELQPAVLNLKQNVSLCTIVLLVCVCVNPVSFF